MPLLYNVHSRQTNYPHIKHTHTHIQAAIWKTQNPPQSIVLFFSLHFFFAIIFPFASFPPSLELWKKKHFIKSRQTVKLMPNSWRKENDYAAHAKNRDQCIQLENNNGFWLNLHCGFMPLRCHCPSRINALCHWLFSHFGFRWRQREKSTQFLRPFFFSRVKILRRRNDPGWLDQHCISNKSKCKK